MIRRNEYLKISPIREWINGAWFALTSGLGFLVLALMALGFFGLLLFGLKVLI